jgi:putative membrane protein
MDFEMLQSYLLHLLSGGVLLGAFMGVYLRFTPFDELALIRHGVLAPAYSLGGALLGFCATLVSSIIHNDSYQNFLLWAGVGLVVQLMAYSLLARLIPNLGRELEGNNVAAGVFAGTLALALGLLNAACMS